MNKVEWVARALCEDALHDPDGREGLLMERAPIVPDPGEPNWIAFVPIAEVAIKAVESFVEA